VNISDEAVEAAAMAIFGVDRATWDLQMPQTRANYLVDARAALEAAAPYIAAAWHDAASEAYVEGSLSADQANIMWNKNPYRSQA
jgi:hypothetical protein